MGAGLEYVRACNRILPLSQKGYFMTTESDLCAGEEFQDLVRLAEGHDARYPGIPPPDDVLQPPEDYPVPVQGMSKAERKARNAAIAAARGKIWDKLGKVAKESTYTLTVKDLRGRLGAAQARVAGFYYSDGRAGCQKFFGTC